MAIVIRVNGNSSGEGFLIAPDGARTFPVNIGLRTDDSSTQAATLQVAGGGASVVFSQTSISITPTEKFVNIHATSISAARNDTVLEVVVGGMIVASFNLTAIANPELWFKGRFQARFATDGDPYNEERGTTAGWNFALEDEPDFVPADSVADSITKPVGRVVRLNNPSVPLRTHVLPIGVTVIAVRGSLSPSGLEDFTAGDSAIGLPVNLGPNTYFAANSPKKMGDPNPAETYGPGQEPMALFECRIGNVFTGKSAASTDRPKSATLASLTAAERMEYGVQIGPTAATAAQPFDNVRLPQLQADFNALSPADQVGTVAGRNLAARIAHLTGSGGNNKTLPIGWSGKEEYIGKVNSQITFSANDSPTLGFLAGYTEFSYRAKFFNYHSDEQCGQVHGNMAANLSADLPPLQNGIYNITTTDTIAFHALNAPAMTEANIDTALGVAPANDKVVLAVNGSFDRLVVSRVVVANPGDPPASWTITSRGASYVFDFRPEASVFPPNLIYMVLPPNHERNHLGNCEGVPPVPPPTVGFARIFYDGVQWKLLVHVGTEGGAGTTMKGTFSGATATIPNGCTPVDLLLLTPTIDFGSIEQGLIANRQIVLINLSGGAVDVTLPALAAPFGPATAATLTIPNGQVGALPVSFTAGPPGGSGPTPVTLTSLPIVAGTLTVTLLGTSAALTNVDTVLVLDRSGSMGEPALQSGGRFATKAQVRNEAVQVFVDLLRDGDRIGLVRFNQAAQPHMAIESAGPPLVGSGRVNAAAALMSTDLDSSGATCVGGGMIEGNTMLGGPSAATTKALVVLTDGVENRSPLINSVVLASDVRAYAIGFGQPQNINVDKLSAITGNTGGYLLVTGDLDAQNEFRLHKYYTQILSGIAGDSIVVDPRFVILPGDVQRTPFYISEADSRFDAVLLDHFPILNFRLEAPDGSVIDPSSVGALGGQYVAGKACRYYRMTMPVFADNAQRAIGKWHIVVDYPGTKLYRGAFVPKRRPPAGEKRGIVRGEEFVLERPYNVLVRARSSIRLDARVVQRSFGTDGAHRIIAELTAFGQPYDQGVGFFAEVTRPDGTTSLIALQKTGPGTFAADLDGKRFGHYSVIVRAAGKTPGGFTLQREQTLSASVVDTSALGEDVVQQEIRDTIKEQQKLLEQLSQQIRDLIAGQPSLPAWLRWWLIFVLLLLLVIALTLVTS